MKRRAYVVLRGVLPRKGDHVLRAIDRRHGIRPSWSRTGCVVEHDAGTPASQPRNLVVWGGMGGRQGWYRDSDLVVLDPATLP